VKTAIENEQNLIVEGCYIPGDWYLDFSEEYLAHIRCRFLIMTEAYIRSHFADICMHACDIERRLEDSGLDMEALIRDNQRLRENSRKEDRILLDGEYPRNLAQTCF